MTSFDYLKKEQKFNACSDAAIAAEKKLYINPANGFETRIIDGQYPERKVAGTYIPS